MSDQMCCRQEVSRGYISTKRFKFQNLVDFCHSGKGSYALYCASRRSSEGSSSIRASIVSLALERMSRR